MDTRRISRNILIGGIMLDQKNVKYFKLEVGRLKKDTPNEISCNCPICGDTKQRLHLINFGDFDLVKCFNSGCTAEDGINMRTFLEVCNSSYLDSYKRETLTEQVEVLKNESNLQEILDRVQETKEVPKAQKVTPKVPQILLDKFQYAKDNKECLEYLRKRKIEPKDDWLFSTDKFYKFNNQNIYVLDFLIIPIYTSNGKFKGWYSRSIKEKKFSTFTLPDADKIWEETPGDTQIVFEGVLDALSTNCLGKSAFLGASMRDTPKDVIIALDNDTTGVQKSIDYAKAGNPVFVWPEIPYKDFNEMLISGYSREEITKIINDNIFSGIIAVTRLKMKEK